MFSLNFTEATSPDTKQSIRLCLAYKKEEDTEWEQISFISSSLVDVNNTLDNLRIIHSRDSSPVEKCSFTTFDTEKNSYDNGWKVTQMFYFERPNKFSIYFQRPFKVG